MPCLSSMFPPGMRTIRCRSFSPSSRKRIGTSIIPSGHYAISFRHAKRIYALSLRGVHMVRQGKCPPFGRTTNRRRYNVCRHYIIPSPTLPPPKPKINISWLSPPLKAKKESSPRRPQSAGAARKNIRILQEYRPTGERRYNLMENLVGAITPSALPYAQP